jgi:hypothetical protein
MLWQNPVLDVQVFLQLLDLNKWFNDSFGCRLASWIKSVLLKWLKMLLRKSWWIVIPQGYSKLRLFIGYAYVNPLILGLLFYVKCKYGYFSDKLFGYFHGKKNCLVTLHCITGHRLWRLYLFQSYYHLHKCLCFQICVIVAESYAQVRTLIFS